MGSFYSSDIKYRLTNINGNSVSIPYIRLSNGQWVPLQQHNPNWYLQYWNAPRALLPGSAYISPTTMVANRSLYP
jgi:hypothetical protein